MPRPYSLGQRAAPKAETRDRIVAAALAIYLDRGMAGCLEPGDRPGGGRGTGHGPQPFPGTRRPAQRCLLGAARRAPDPDAGDLRGPQQPSRSRRTARRGARGLLRAERAVVAGLPAGTGPDQRVERWHRAGVLRGHRSTDARRARRARDRRAIGGGRRNGDRAADVLRPTGPRPLVRRRGPADAWN